MRGSVTAAPQSPGVSESEAVVSPLGRVARLCRRRREQILYLVVGGWNTLFGYAVWALLQYLLHDYIYYLVILAIAWVPSVINAYVCYRLIVFRSRGRILREFARFCLVYVVTLVLGLVGLPILLRLLPFSIYVVQAGFMAVVVIASYLSHKFFSFGGGKRPTVGDRGRLAS